MKKKLILPVVLITLAAGIWWWRKPGGSTEAGEAKPVAQVQVAPIVKEPIGRMLAAYGTVESSAGGAVAVTLAYDCVVRTVVATAGSRVAAGQLLARVAPTPDARLQLDSARGVATLAERSLAAARQRYDLRLATGDDLRTAEQAAQDARLKLESLERRGLGEAGGRLIAPVAGVVVKLDAQPGLTAPAGTVLATVAAFDGLEARLGLELSDAALVAAGQKVALTAVNRPKAVSVQSAVGSIGAVADAATGSLDVRVPLPEGSRWLPGERVQAAIEVERKVALLAPRGAVLPDGDQEVLYTVKGGAAVKHVVRVGISSGDQVEISGAGLEAGDSVVVQGNYELSDGMGVQVGDKGATAGGKDPVEAKP